MSKQFCKTQIILLFIFVSQVSYSQVFCKDRLFAHFGYSYHNALKRISWEMATPYNYSDSSYSTSGYELEGCLEFAVFEKYGIGLSYEYSDFYLKSFYYCEGKRQAILFNCSFHGTESYIFDLYAKAGWGASYAELHCNDTSYPNCDRITLVFNYMAGARMMIINNLGLYLELGVRNAPETFITYKIQTGLVLAL